MNVEKCVACEGSGWMLTAPMETVAVWRGSNPTPVRESKANWDMALPLPCFACFPANLKVMT